MSFWEEELIARDLLVHRLVDNKARIALKQFVRRRHWRMRVDELLGSYKITRRQAAISLVREAMQDPFGRIDRYSLGALRRMLARQ
jgi:hypothetical protein